MSKNRRSSSAKQKEFEGETLRHLKYLEAEMTCSRKMIHEMCLNMSLDVEHLCIPNWTSDGSKGSGADHPNVPHLAHEGKVSVVSIADDVETIDSGAPMNRQNSKISQISSAISSVNSNGTPMITKGCAKAESDAAPAAEEDSDVRRPETVEMLREAEKVRTVRQSFMSITPQKEASSAMASEPSSHHRSSVISSRRGGLNRSLSQENVAIELAAKAIVLFTRRPKRSASSIAIWTFLDDPDSSKAAKTLDTVIPYFFLLTVGFTFLQTMDPRPLSDAVSSIVELSIDALLSMEVIVRYCVSPSRGPMFFLSPFNVIDVAAALPLFFRITFFAQPSFNSEDWEAILLCVVPILRLLKLMRRFQKIHLLLGAFKLALEALPVLMFCQALIALTFASAFYLVEPRDNIETLPKALYFTLVTMTTVGYGDVTPVSTFGTCIATVLTIVSVLYMAIPLAIVGHAFNQVWEDRDKILLVQKARAALQQWGYSAGDIPVLCQIFDTSGEGELDINDFSRMIRMMHIGLKVDRVIELFDSFDSDGSGTVDAPELVRELFPAAYLGLYGIARDSQTPTNTRLSVPPKACQCGSRLLPDSDFCRKCGKRVTAPPDPDAESTSALPSQPSGNLVHVSPVGDENNSSHQISKSQSEDSSGDERSPRWASRRRNAASCQHVQT